jgi:hypothetical protein
LSAIHIIKLNTEKSDIGQRSDISVEILYISDLNALVAYALAKISIILCSEWGVKTEGDVLFENRIEALELLGEGGGGNGLIGIEEVQIRNDHGGYDLRLGGGLENGKMKEGKIDEDLNNFRCEIEGGQPRRSSLGKSRHLSFDDSKRNSLNGTTMIPNRDFEIMIGIIMSVCEEVEIVASRDGMGPIDIKGLDGCSNVRNEDNKIGNNESYDLDGVRSRDEEDMSPSLLLLSNPAYMLCSIALCSIAELPQYVHGLVEGGILKLLRKWLDMGTELINSLKDRIELEEGNRNWCFQYASKGQKQVFELLTNTAVTVNFMICGSDIQEQVKNKDGYVYDQMMSEGLPAALVRFVSASECELPVGKGSTAVGTRVDDDINSVTSLRKSGAKKKEREKGNLFTL